MTKISITSTYEMSCRIGMKETRTLSYPEPHDVSGHK